MTYELPHLLTLSESLTRTYYELARLNLMNEWWHWLVLAALLIALATFVLWTYRRDTAEVSRPLRWALSGLRLAALAGLFVFFLQLEKRVEHKVVKNSRAVVLVDTSQSMGLDDAVVDGAVGANQQPVSRIENVVAALSSGPLLGSLREPARCRRLSI